MTTSTTERVIEWLRTALSFDGALDAQSLMDEAMRNTGLSDFCPPYFHEGLRRLITSSGDIFLPITSAVVTLYGNERFVVEQEVIMVNGNLIRYLAKVESKPPAKP